jgi:hypothetical protein
MSSAAKSRLPSRPRLKVTENVCLIYEALKGGRWTSVSELHERHPDMSLGTVKNVVAALGDAGLLTCNTACHPWQYKAQGATDLVSTSIVRQIEEAAAIFREKRAA